MIYCLFVLVIYTCRVRSQTLVSGPTSIDGQKTRLYVIEYSECK